MTQPPKCIKDDLRERLAFHRSLLPFLLFECIALYAVFKFAESCGM